MVLLGLGLPVLVALAITAAQQVAAKAHTMTEGKDGPTLQVLSMLQLALELLEPAEREIVLGRQWQGLTFKELGEGLGISEEAARKRFDRAVAHLAQLVQRLRSGQLRDVLRA